MTKSTPNFPPMRFDNKEIDECKPWSDDALGREKFANVLTNKIKNGVSPYTISVNGGWGTGKTFMLQRWRQQLKNDKYKAIYYNAWEDDFCVNPLVSIIGQIAAEIKDDSLNSLIVDVKKIASSLFYEKTIRFSLVKKIITSPLVKRTAKFFLSKKIQEYVGMTIKESQPEINNIIDEYSKQTLQTKELKKSLEKLTTKIEKDTGHPLIFIIDELDRCRPTFAIEVLERIKHLFNIPGIIFVLGMNKTVLEKSITHVYGDIGSKEYLRRFCDIDLTLHAIKSVDYCHHLINTYKNSLNALIQGKDFKSYVDSIMDFYQHLFDYLNLSLRDTEYCFRSLCFVLDTKDSFDKGEGWAATCLIILRIKNFELYWRFVQGKSSCEEVISDICGSIPETVDGKIGIYDDIIIREIYALANDKEWEEITTESDLSKAGHIRSFPKLDNLKKSVRPLIKSQGSNYFNKRYENSALQRIAALLDLVDR